MTDTDERQDMDTIESRNLGKVEGFDIEARLVPDLDASTDESDCYDSEAILAFRQGDWSYVGTIVTASKAGVVLGEASLWASEYGSFPVDGEALFISPLDGDDEDFVNGYGPDLIAEAITAARDTIKRIEASK